MKKNIEHLKLDWFGVQWIFTLNGIQAAVDVNVK